VVARGLNDGEIVVTSNQYRLQPGTQVRTGANAGTALRTAASGAQPPAATGAGLR
jgi:hypothetical protein